MAEKKYIEREKLNDTLDELCVNDSLYNALQTIPSANVAPVRHGRWEEQSDRDELVCSYCNGGYTLYDETPYCPNCGAKMDGKE